MAIRFELIEPTSGKVSWRTAQQRAVSTGGRLAVLNTKGKHDAAISALENSEGREIFRFRKPLELLVKTAGAWSQWAYLFGPTNIRTVGGVNNTAYQLAVWAVLSAAADEKSGMIGDRFWGVNLPEVPPNQTERIRALSSFFSSDYPEEGLVITEDQYNAIFNYKFDIFNKNFGGSIYQSKHQDLQEFISSDGVLAGYPSVWIGLTDKNIENSWKWVDGSDLTDGTRNAYWADNSDLSGDNKKEPSNRSAGEDYALILGSDRSQPGRYSVTAGDLGADNIADGRYGYLVEYAIDEDDVNPDSPNDFIPEDRADDPVFAQQSNFDEIPSLIEDYISYADFKDYGISLGDTFDTWRKKTNGITKFLMDSTGSFAHCVLQRSLTAPYQWGITTNPNDKRNIQSATFTGNASRLSIQFEKDRPHKNHVVIMTVGRSSGGKDLSFHNSYGGAPYVSASELTGLWTDSYTKSGLDIGSAIPNGWKKNNDKMYYINSHGSVFATTDPDAYFDKISLVVF